MAVTTHYQFYKGERVTWTATPASVQDVTGWSLQCNVKRQKSDAATLLVLDNGGHGGIALTTPTAGVFTVTLTSAQCLTLGAGSFYYDVWRTDSGAETELANGILNIKSTVKW